MSPDLLERVQDKIAPSEDGCWLWQAATISTGYAALRVRGQTRLAHRVVYEETFGEIPEGLQLHHVCEVRSCVNPEHLAAVTPREHLAAHGFKSAHAGVAARARKRAERYGI